MRSRGITAQRAIKVLTAVMAPLMVTGAIAGPAHAEDNPAAITVALGKGPAFSAQFVPILTFGSPILVSASSTSGQPVAIAGQGGCAVDMQATSPGAPAQAIVSATSTSQPCQLSVTSAAGSGFTVGSGAYTLRTQLGSQLLSVKSAGRRVERGSQVILGAKRLVTDRGQPASVTVTNGTKNCAIVTKKSVVTVQFGDKEGACTVAISAPGIDGQFIPYRRLFVFTIA
jgi:hypothetical protein